MMRLSGEQVAPSGKCTSRRDPILDEATWRAVAAKLGDARTIIRADGGTYVIRTYRRRKARRYLLSSAGRVIPQG